MSTSDELLKELETHIVRVIESYRKEDPYTPVLNVADKRAALATALAKYIDNRINERINALGRQIQPALQHLDPNRRPR
jgi:hypothetical protein